MKIKCKMIILLLVAISQVFFVSDMIKRHKLMSRLEKNEPAGKSKPFQKHWGYDFLFINPDSQPAIRNFVLHNEGLPTNWEIMCDGNGHYLPAHNGYNYDISWCVRTNKREAILAAWRAELMINEHGAVWKPCN